MTGLGSPCRKMTGRAAEGLCGGATSPSAAPAAAALDPYAQARKALSYRSPFDDDTEAARPSDLPAVLAAFLYRHSDGRHKNKKTHGHSAHKKSAGHPSNVWDETEEYFRPLTLNDVDALAPKLAFVPSPTDSCLSLPVLPKKALVLDAGAVEVSPGTLPEEQVKHESVETEQQAKKAGQLEAAEEEEEEQVKKEVELETVEEERSAIEVGKPGICSASLAATEQDKSLSMNWLLGSTHRVMLTTERPNKKHKFLGADAGLDQLLRLPYSEAMASEQLCDVCFLGPTRLKWNQLLQCHSCKVWVHQKCYGMHGAPTSPWLCSMCRHLEVTGKLVVKGDPRPCVLCPKEGGALKPVGRDAGGRLSSSDTVEFAHLFCSLWTPDVYVEDTRAMEPVLNIGGIQKTQRKLVCYLCKVKHGFCVQCSHGTCRTSFHPRCARDSKHQMEIWGNFGCDNVELRAFCLRHTSSQETDSVRQSASFRVGSALSVTMPSLGITETNQLSRLRLSCSNGDKSMIQGEITSSAEMDKIENTSRRDTLCARTNLEDGDTQLVKNSDSNEVYARRITIKNRGDLALVLRKLIDRRKIRVDDMASEIGISPCSLDAALLGEPISPGLKFKVSKWFHDSVHIWKFLSDSAVSSGHSIAKVDGKNAAKRTGSFLPDDVKRLDHATPDAILVKSLPLRTRTKSKVKILKDNRTTCSVAVTVEQNGNVKLADQNGEVPDILTEDTKGDVSKEKSSLHDHDRPFEPQDISNTTLEGTADLIESTSSLNLSPGRNGNPLKMENNDSRVEQHQPVSITEKVSSVESTILQANEAKIPAPYSLENSCWGEPDYGVDMVISGGNNEHMVDQSGYVHSLIQRKLMQMQSYPISKQKYGETYPNDNSGKTTLTVETDTTLSADTDQLCSSSFNDINHASGTTQIDQLLKAKSMGLLELSPGDELEGEMLYLQTRLLDKAVAIKRSCEDLILRVVRSLHQELDALNSQRWDLILVTRYFCEVKEAKKRGRKEKKHKEAQAVLAAAVAAASSRNSLLRKDANDEVMPNHQESPLKVSGVSGRALSSPLAPPAKDSRLAVSKVLSDNPSGIFKIPDLQENALFCDICGRAESLLNRIFVCSSCKVAVHLNCYRKIKNPIYPWKCELCEEMASHSRSPRIEAADGNQRIHYGVNCVLCRGATGAFRKSTDGQWVHAFCAEWLLKSRYRRGQQNPVEGMDTILKKSNAHSCCICHLNFGVCLKCSYGHCQVAFHPSCARISSLYMNVKASSGRLQHKAYCEKHSLEQREADSQQHGAEELKAIKQIRVNLEKVRLLCERIIRREKLKRDLVLCFHEILASRRDAVAFSVLVRSSFSPPGVRSDCATTSRNDKSCSRTIQRSDDVTVDGTASGRCAGRIPLHINADSKTFNCSTSQPSFKRKFVERAHFSGKQLHGRHGSIPSTNLAEDGEHLSKERKHTQTFPKELLMTSDEASLKNQRLPKGFVYVPVGSLSKEKPSTDNSESCEPREAGG